MPVIRTNREMDNLETEDFIDLIPEEFLEDGEAYVRCYGDVVYQRLVNVVICDYSCLIPLNDGSRWKFEETTYLYSPLSKAANN